MSKEDFRKRSLPLPIKGMQTKSTLRVHLTPVRVIKINTRLWRNGNPHSLSVGLRTVAAIPETGEEKSQKLQIQLPQDPTVALPVIDPKDLTLHFTDAR